MTQKSLEEHAIINEKSSIVNTNKTVENPESKPQPIFLNRELTWLSFNKRVLSETENTANPLLERVKFLAIVNSNLDEFFMKRIGGLKQQVGAGVSALSADGRTAQEQIDACYEVISEINASVRRVWMDLQTKLREEHIEITTFSQLSAENKANMRQYFLSDIYPLLTPQAMDPAHPFPFISNLSLNLLVKLEYPNDAVHREAMARLKIPVGQGSRRLIAIRGAKGHQYIALEDLITQNLDVVFPGMEIKSVEIFRIRRNAVTEKDEERAEDLLELIESELRERRLAPIVSMQFSKGMHFKHKGMLSSELQLNEEKDVFEVDGLLGMSDLMELMSVDRNDLKDSPHKPVENAGLVGENNIFHAIRKNGPFLLHFPYESFSASVERFVRDASRDPKVIGIKMTIYRTSSDSKIIDYLIDASQNGKQVTVVVEVKARFDESANIRWANKLEEAGINITYGIVGLKTHAKLIYVLRRDYNGLRRYAHIGTGNYHSGTARLYSDLGILTADDEIGEDLTEIFNYLTTGYTPKRHYKKILPAPRHMKKGLLNRIHREIKHAQAGKEALIQLKTNALEDVDITQALYDASQAGVRVDLLIRDTCRLAPGVKGLSENIRVISISGRFLEHARIYYFKNNGDEQYYIGSADLMKRNLESRVEVITLIDTPNLKEQLRRFIDSQLSDNQNAWEMQSNGEYTRVPNIGAPINAQTRGIDDAKARHKQVNRLQLRKTKSLR